MVPVIVQIPGASRPYPIEMMPEFFQRLAVPAIHLRHSGHARTDCGCQNALLERYVPLAVVILPAALFIGLVVRRLAMNLNALFDERLTDTDLMITERNAGVDSQLRFSMARESPNAIRKSRTPEPNGSSPLPEAGTVGLPHVGGAAVRTADSAVHHPTENRDAYVVDRVDHRHRHLSDHRGRIPKERYAR